MNKEIQVVIIDLLTKKATVGLDAGEQEQLDKLNADAGLRVDDSFEIAAAAIGLVGLTVDEQLPGHLHARIIASADNFFENLPPSQAAARSESDTALDGNEYQNVFTAAPRRSWNWLGWAVAAFAFVALAVNVWITRINPPEIAGNIKNHPATPEKLTPEQELAALLASQPNIITASWGAGNMKDLKEIGGEVIWSDEKQKGFMRLHGLPVNDKKKETYQLWIFDATQDEKTPIDGGVFDVDQYGEVIIPINAKLKARDPKLFAITVERPGGVVVSKKEKIAALAKVVKTET